MTRFVRNYANLVVGQKIEVHLEASKEMIEMKVVSVPDNFTAVTAMSPTDKFVFERRRGRGVRTVEARRYGHDCFLVTDVPGKRSATRLSRVHLALVEKREEVAA